MTNRSGKLPENVDELLDRALASYTPAAPRPGLEDRLQARLAAAIQPAAPGSRLALRWLWAASAALAASVALIAVQHLSHTPVLRPEVANNPVHPQPAALHAPTYPRPSMPSQPIHAPSPRRATQPTQRQLIAQLLANGPEAIPSLVRADEEQDKPIEIQPIRFDPLVIEPIHITPIEDSPAEAGGSI